ncbi:phospholipase D-like domain-containing protein [Rhizobium phaseoli]|uniref:phospholipase D-like domain-containing protein n=1 Tax=Rhizobium phaseoli TaxID=396 RepID=UPI0007EA9497|nr:phospholipase D-like domain-containing protein [Rhizobium phaseoli]ANL38319.1 phospholipase D-like domain-containing protein [Rhizobium phaseoli]ANM02023.1 phospholipase D-like domain-containing protein [Rhizobium phaseoli]
MDTNFRVTGKNAAAQFSLTIHRGDGMLLLAMDWNDGLPPANFVGFAIQYREPGTDFFKNVRNRIGFPGQEVPEDGIRTTDAPIQKFRWVHFPFNADLPGAFLYRVMPMFKGADGVLSPGEAQEAELALMRETIPGKLNVAFTRGYVSSQAFVRNFADGGDLITLVPPQADDGLNFVPTHTDPERAFAWMGFEARKETLSLLERAHDAGAEVRVIAYDLNLPEVVQRLEALGPRLKVIIDDSERTKGHGRPESPETHAAERLIASAGAANVKRQRMANIQHHKSIAVRGGGIDTVIYGSTNHSWRGFYVQSNNSLVVQSVTAVGDYFSAFDNYFSAGSAADFMASGSSGGWHHLGLDGVDAKVAFSPHSNANGLLNEIGADIDTAGSSVFFSLAFLGQTTKGAIGPALGRALRKPDVHVMGIADGRVHAENLGLTVFSADNRRRVVRAAALTGNVPPPFVTEPSGLAGVHGNERGTRMHHKFVVLDFDKPTARVYLGSYNFSEPADSENGENLVLVRDRTVATSYMIEALRMYDHYRFRVAAEDGEETGHPIELQLPPQQGEAAWFERDWTDPVRARDRQLFARAD